MEKLAGLIRKHWLGFVGLGIVAFYLTSAFGLVDYPDKLFILLLLAISPVAIVGVVAISNELTDLKPSLAVQVAKLYGVAAFAAFEMMLCVQLGSRIYFREHLLKTPSDAVPAEVVSAIFKGVNSVQFTLDIAFDIFYCLMIALFGIKMMRNAKFGSAVGTLGLVSGSGLLALNMWTFPYPPGESGLIDLGPLTGVWWIWVLVLLIRFDREANAG